MNVNKYIFWSITQCLDYLLLEVFDLFVYLINLQEPS